MGQVTVDGLTGWQALNVVQFKDEYTFELLIPNKKTFICMNRKTVEIYINANKITSADLNSCFWTRTWNGPKQTEQTVQQKMIVEFQKMLDKYSGEIKCG